MDHAVPSRALPKRAAPNTTGSLLLLGLGERLAIAVLLSGVAFVGVALALAPA